MITPLSPRYDKNDITEMYMMIIYKMTLRIGCICGGNYYDFSESLLVILLFYFVMSNLTCRISLDIYFINDIIKLKNR